MVSKAVASLDLWLAEAEEVLAESLELALSPSEAEQLPVEHTWTVTSGAFALGLTDLLTRLCLRPGRWILVAEDLDRSDQFCQFMAFEDGSLLAEASSGTGRSGDSWPSAQQEEALAALGWEAPHLPESPNWRWIEPTMDPDVADVAERAVRTMVDVFGTGPSDRVFLKLFPSSHRGGTPASEVIEGQDQVLGYESRKGFRPTDEPWAEWYRTLFPGFERPADAYELWQYATTAVDTVEALWHAREELRSAWVAEHGNDPSGWPASHPPAVVVRGSQRIHACLGCTWMDAASLVDGAEPTEGATGHARHEEPERAWPEDRSIPLAVCPADV